MSGRKPNYNWIANFRFLKKIFIYKDIFIFLKGLCGAMTQYPIVNVTIVSSISNRQKKYFSILWENEALSSLTCCLTKCPNTELYVPTFIFWDTQVTKQEHINFHTFPAFSSCILIIENFIINDFCFKFPIFRNVACMFTVYKVTLS